MQLLEQLKVKDADRRQLLEQLKVKDADQRQLLEQLKGKGAQITLIEKPNQSGDKVYINIGTISEVMEELLPKVPKAEDFGPTASEDNTGEEVPF